MPDISAIVATKLHFASKHDAALATTMMIADDILQSGIIGVGSQFLKDAATYDKRYFSFDGMLPHIKEALKRSTQDMTRVRSVLDIGCGSGNATFALATLCPQAQIVASDLSPDLLILLEGRARSLGIADRITPLIANASTLELAPGKVDLIVGSSMLHHMVDPAATVHSLLRGLVPGGTACFFEPFLPGYYVLRHVMRALKELNAHRGGISAANIDLLDQLVFGIDFVSTADRSHAAFADLDDKWLFTKENFRRWGDLANCSVQIYTTNPQDETFEKKLSAMITAASGTTMVLPPWASQYLADAEICRTGSLRDDLLMEGAIVFQKRPF